VKKLNVFIFSLFLSFSAMAQNWDSVVIVAGTFGTIISSQYAVYQSLIKRELKGWANKETGTSVKLENQCGIQTEFHLIGDYKRNYIMMAVSNHSGKQVALNFRQVKFTINGDRVRYPGYSYQVADEMVNDGWWVLANIPLPMKDEFASYEHLKVEIPIFTTGSKESCTIVTEFKRSARYPNEDVSFNYFEFMFDTGPSLTQTGNVDRLGDPNIIWGMDFNWYFSAMHGVGMAFQWESDFTSNGSIFSGDFHYVYRRFLTPKFSFNFEPGVGYQTLVQDYNNCYRCNQNLSSTLMVDYRLMFNYVLGTWNMADVEIMNFFIGAGVVHQYGFSGETNGSRLGLLFRLGMGF